MPLGHGYTIEEQLTSEAIEGGIQIDVFPTFAASVEFRNGSGAFKDIGKTPQELCIAKGRRIDMVSR